ncbi:MAG: endo alpha-1,4 polygalactosaminidase [Nonomuraea sp.]|nr:endo alpha-1,4 polygalactosaminidase [Nonomuraea sp.]
MRALLVAVAMLLAMASPARAAGPRWQPEPGSRWQYQLQGQAAFAATGGIDVDVCAVPYTGGACVRPTVFDIDLYVDEGVSGNDHTVNTAAVRAIHARGGHAVCYVDAGGIEKFRPDYREAVAWDAAHGRRLIGKPYPGFPDESYANINNDAGQRDFMLRRMDRRVAACARAGFDAVEFDVVNAHEDGRKTTGWAISAATQLTYNRALAAMAHRRGLSAALKNDLSQIPDLVRDFDFAVNEQCVQYGECGEYAPFLRAGKAVLQVEYTMKGGSDTASSRCATANRLKLSSIHKNRDATLYSRPYRPCR